MIRNHTHNDTRYNNLSQHNYTLYITIHSIMTFKIIALCKATTIKMMFSIMRLRIIIFRVIALIILSFVVPNIIIIKMLNKTFSLLLPTELIY
jgi:hypothetical protein